MRISTEMAKAINDQISYETSSASAYIAIGSWCERIGYDGSSAFFFEQAAEENGHTKAISDLIDMAEKEKDRSTYSFLQWFVTEQIEEETLFHTILQKFDLLGKDKLAIYQIDQSLASVRSQVMSKQTGLK
jgi:ferritin